MPPRASPEISGETGANVADRLNILFIQTDQMTIDVLAAYGNPVCKTPHLDALAARGVVFENAYCNFPLCAPSRFSMATGQLASRIGAYDNAAELPASQPTYAHYLRALGYRTCLSGKMHFVGPDQLHGFERRLTTDIYPSSFAWTADWSAEGFHGATDIRLLTASGICARSVQIDYDEEVTHRALQEIYDCARPTEERPFFLQVSYTHPHDPYLCLQRHWDLYDGVEIPAPRTGMIPEAENDPHSIRVLSQHGLLNAEIPEEIIHRARRAYCGTVSYIDDAVRRLLDALEATGQAENTAVIFCSDHGEMLGERGLWLKKTFFEPALRVPLIVSTPEQGAGLRAQVLCSLVDLLPTLAGIAAGGAWEGAVEPLDGTDLMGLTDAGVDARPVYAELLCEGIRAPIFMIRRGQWKLITSTGDADMLFDLGADPDERRNLAGEPAHTEVLSALQAEAASVWDSQALSDRIRLSQKRRLLIRDAHTNGPAPDWDFLPDGEDAARYFRGQGNYNDWAFDYLPPAQR